MRTGSNRALARALGVSETAVRKAEKAGRIRRAVDGSWDVERVRAAWRANTDAGQQRATAPGLAPRCTGMCTAWATTRPSESKRAVEPSPLSFMSEE